MALLDDLQIERYSRQIVLPEIGARGQRRLLDAHVGIVGSGAAAERVLAYLAAAGVGHVRGSAVLAGAVDPEQTDVAFVAWGETGGTRGEAPLDALVVAPADQRSPADQQSPTDEHPPAEARSPAEARRRFWIADGRAAAIPPCAACAGAALGPPTAVDPTLVTLRDALLATVIATEVVKALLEIGTPLVSQVLTFDPADSGVRVTAIAARPGCTVCAAHG